MSKYWKMNRISIFGGLPNILSILPWIYVGLKMGKKPFTLRKKTPAWRYFKTESNELHCTTFSNGKSYEVTLFFRPSWQNIALITSLTQLTTYQFIPVFIIKGHWPTIFCHVCPENLLLNTHLTLNDLTLSLQQRINYYGIQASPGKKGTGITLPIC